MRPAIIRIGSRGRRRSCFLRDGCVHLPSSQRRPNATVLGSSGNGDVTGGQPGFLGFIDNAVIERHGLRGGFVDARVFKAAVSKNRDRRELGFNVAGTVRSQFKQRCGTQLVGRTLLCLRHRQSGHSDEHKDKAGSKAAFAI